MLSYGLLKKVRELSLAQLADIALQMAEVHPETFLKAIADPELQKAKSPPTMVATLTHRIPGTTDEVNITVALSNILSDMGKTGQRVQGIKELRAATGLALHPAKELFDAVYYKGPKPIP